MSHNFQNSKFKNIDEFIFECSPNIEFMEESFTSLLYSPLPLRYELEIESKARNEKWEQYLIWLDKMKREEVSRKEELKKVSSS